MKQVMHKQQHRTDKKNNFINRKKCHAHENKSTPNFSPEPKLQPIDKCRSFLLQKLQTLKDLTILRYSLMPNDNTFEILEFYGDSVLYERISFFIMQTRRFMSPHLLTQLRCAVIQNKNLAKAFDTLGLAALLSDSAKSLQLKDKADVVEAIVGELSESYSHTNNSSVDTTLVKGVLDELLAYICYTGERDYFLALQNDEARKDVSCMAKKRDQAEVEPRQPSQVTFGLVTQTPTVNDKSKPKKMLKRTKSASSVKQLQPVLSLYQNPATKSKEFRQEATLDVELDKFLQPSSPAVAIPKSPSTKGTVGVQPMAIGGSPPSPSSAVHTSPAPVSTTPVKQPAKLLLYSTDPNPSNSLLSPFPNALTYDMFISGGGSYPPSSKAPPPMTRSPSSSAPGMDPYSTSFVTTTTASLWATSAASSGLFCANQGHLGGRSITEYHSN